MSLTHPFLRDICRLKITRNNNPNYFQIEKITKDQLIDLPSLALLTLTGNKISDIEKGVMADSKNLKYLFLGSNNISKLAEGVLGQFNQIQVKNYLCPNKTFYSLQL